MLRTILIRACAILATTWLSATAAEPATAPTLSKPASAEKSPSTQGFIQRWLILEPISYNNSLADRAIKEAVKKEYFTNQFGILPRDGDKVTVADSELTWHAVDSSEYNVNLYHFAHSKNKPTSNVLFWAVTIINCQRDLQDVRLAIGSNAASAWWVNGVEVIGIYGDRQTVVDDGVSKKLTLKKGPNVIRCAVFNGGGATDFCARLVDADGEPLKDGFTITLNAATK